MYGLVRDGALRYPSQPALSFMGRNITYAELIRLIDQMADALYTLGFRQGNVATLCIPNIPDAVIAFYAVNRLGGVANMVHPLTPAEELAHYIQTTDSEYLFILDAFLPKHLSMLEHSQIRKTIVASVPDYLSIGMAIGFWLKSGRKIPRVPATDAIICWKDALALAAMSVPGAGQAHETTDAHAPAVYLHSGGTTGSPKTITLSSYNFNVLAIQGPQIIGFDMDTFDPSAQDFSMVSILPMFHGFGLCMGIHTIMANGMRSILVPQFSPDKLAEVIRKEHPSMMAAVPTLLEGIMKSKKLADADLSCLAAVFCGGDSLPSELKTRFDAFVKSRNGTCQVREGYGLTETVTVCAVNPIGDNRANTVGVPLADMAMKVVEPGTEREMPVGTDGEFCIAGPTVMLGYLNDPDATKETIHTHADGLRWVHTGDYGFMDEDGFFHFKQRIKRILKVSGIPVFPSQIEDILMKVPGVREACVIGVPHPYKMQVVKAFIVRDAGAAPEEAMREAIIRHCADNIIRYAVPVEIEFR
ncbi:MAG TPA: AMP-binding protein, partial [Clostridia bacterium]